jgi:pimeloyl-ACP methyl ester carboxylesterase
VSKTILIAGTWGLGEDDWWKVASPFWQTAKAKGIELAAADDPYLWTTALDGLKGGNDEWRIAAAALRWFCGAKDIELPNIIAHSHGGQVALLAVGQGLLVDTLVTVATPVRADVLEAMDTPAGRGQNVARWFHIHTGAGDTTQLLGSLGDGGLAIQREMPGAENIYEPDQTHSGLMESDLWTARDWWRFLK